MNDKNKKPKPQTPSEYLRESANYLAELADWLEQFKPGGAQTEDDDSGSNPPVPPPPPPVPGRP